VGDATLRYGWPPYVPTGVSKRMPFRLEGLNLDAPPTLFLLGEQFFHLVNGHVCMKLIRLKGCTEQTDDGSSPSLHQQIAVVMDSTNPSAGRGV
jgi:hypothetical protein